MGYAVHALFVGLSIQTAGHRYLQITDADTIYIWRDYGFNRGAYGRAVRDREVVGSNPIAPTFKTNKLWLPIGSHILFMTLSTTLSIQTVRAE